MRTILLGVAAAVLAACASREAATVTTQKPAVAINRETHLYLEEVEGAEALAWVRAMGEFGIVLIVAYFPQGIPVKLWTNLQDSGLDATYPLLWLFFVVALPLPLALGLLSRRQPVQ